MKIALAGWGHQECRKEVLRLMSHSDPILLNWSDDFEFPGCENGRPRTRFLLSHPPISSLSVRFWSRFQINPSGIQLLVAIHQFLNTLATITSLKVWSLAFGPQVHVAAQSSNFFFSCPITRSSRAVFSLTSWCWSSSRY